MSEEFDFRFSKRREMSFEELQKMLQKERMNWAMGVKHSQQEAVVTATLWRNGEEVCSISQPEYVLTHDVLGHLAPFQSEVGKEFILYIVSAPTPAIQEQVAPIVLKEFLNGLRKFWHLSKDQFVNARGNQRDPQSLLDYLN